MKHRERREHKRKEKSISEFGDSCKQPNMHAIGIFEAEECRKIFE